MLRECSNINSYIKKHSIKTLYSGHKKHPDTYVGDSIEFRNGCSYTPFLFKLFIMDDRLWLTLDIKSTIIAEPNSEDYLNINGSWFVKFIKLNNIDKNLFKDGNNIQFIAVKRNYTSQDTVSTLTFILMNDGWLIYSQQDNSGLSGEELVIEKILIPSVRMGFNSMIEQKKLSYNFIKNSLSYYNKLFIIQ